MEKGWIEEAHPEWYYDPREMKTLILGSFPPPPGKSRHVNFYYPNRNNLFWKVLARIANRELDKTTDTPRARKQIMKTLKTGIQNMGAVILRKDNSSEDTKIRIIKFHDILSIIRKHAELKYILLPGFSARDSTYRSFLKYLEQNNIVVPEIGKVNHETVFDITVFGRKITCAVLNSTSPRARVSLHELEAQFRKYIRLEP